MAISRSIVDAVRSKSGRFLDKDPQTGLWHDIGDRKAIEKTSQALRDGAADLRKQLSQDLGDPAFLNSVFEETAMDTSNNSSTTINSGTSQKEKAKPVKAKPPVKKGHRRTKSNPNTLAEKKKIVLAKKQKMSLPEELQEPSHSPLDSVGSLPTSPLAGRPTFGRAASFDYSHAAPYAAPPTPPSALHHYHAHSGHTLKCASFDSAQPSHSWQYASRRAGHPPLSPSSMPGRYPLSPPGSYPRLPISPVHQSWSPASYSRSPPFRSWRASPSPFRYSHGELSVPKLGRKSSDSSVPRVPLSPVRTTSSGAQENLLYRPPPILRAGSAEDFIPPPSPGSWVKPKEEKIIVAKPMKSTISMEVDKDDDAAYMSPTCTLFGSCFMMDMEKTGVEVVLSKDNKGESIEVNPAEDDDGTQRSLSPLPFLRNESEGSTSFLDTLMQLPIAPCAPQDVE